MTDSLVATIPMERKKELNTNVLVFFQVLFVCCVTCFSSSDASNLLYLSVSKYSIIGQLSGQFLTPVYGRAQKSLHSPGHAKKNETKGYCYATWMFLISGQREKFFIFSEVYKVVYLISFHIDTLFSRLCF